MKTLKFIKYFFTLLGGAALFGTYSAYNSTAEFIATSITADGTVVKLLKSQSSSKKSITYRPLVQFTDETGTLIEFSSSTSSNPPSYSVGESVEVLYKQQSPQQAKIKGFFSIWGGVIIYGAIGTVLFLVGGSSFVIDIRKRNVRKHLKLHGTKIEADIQSAEKNTTFSVNGRNPYRVICQWENPSTSKVHVFTSENIWFDPNDYIKSDKITVLIDKRNPKKHIVDLSFLPEIG